MDIVQVEQGKEITLAIVGDLHINSTVGLAPKLIRLDDGGYYQQSKFQEKLWECWTDFWIQAEREKKETGQLAVILNGDLVDGDHHRTSQIVTRNLTYQHYAALEVLEPVSRIADALFVIRGTDVHAGEAGQHEDAIARDLQAVKSPEGSWSHWMLRARINGVGFDVAHHGSMGRLAWTSANLLLRQAVEIELEYHRAGQEPPAYAIRSHNHRWGDSSFNAPVRLLALAGWQGLTSFVNSKHPGAIPQIGGLLFRVGNGEATFRVVSYTRESWLI